MAGTCANQLTARLFLFPLKRNHGTAEHGRMEQLRIRGQSTKCRRPRICAVTAYVKRHVTAYVEYVTAEPLEARSRIVKDCTTVRFCRMGSSHLKRSVFFRSTVRNGRQLVAAPPGG